MNVELMQLARRCLFQAQVVQWVNHHEVEALHKMHKGDLSLFSGEWSALRRDCKEVDDKEVAGKTYDTGTYAKQLP